MCPRSKVALEVEGVLCQRQRPRSAQQLSNGTCRPIRYILQACMHTVMAATGYDQLPLSSPQPLQLYTLAGLITVHQAKSPTLGIKGHPVLAVSAP